MNDIVPIAAPSPAPTPSITPTVEQSRAIDVVSVWLKNGSSPVLKLFGVAGTGKSTIAKHIADALDGQTSYVAYTGRACDILRRHGMPAQTVHSALYLPMSERNDELVKLREDLETCTDPIKERRLISRIESLSEPKFIRRSSDPDDPRRSPLVESELIIADEMSMLSKAEADDLLSFKIPLLVLGDPGQLPPIEGRGYFSTGQPDVLLTQIHRQALDSPIIQLAMAAREKRPLKIGTYGTSRVLARRDVQQDLACSVSQVLCGSNKTRLELTKELRAFKGYDSPLPQSGEKLICLRNNPRSGLFNGSELVLTGDVTDDPDKPYFVRVPTDKGVFRAYRDCFERPERLKAMDYRKRAAADEFDFSSVLTIHRAQGGQWESVLFWDDRMFSWDADLYSKLRYTAISRAEDRVVVAI